jgi:hypothetical protein
MTRRLAVFIGVVFFAVGWSAAGRSAEQTPAGLGRVYVTVVAADGSPVTDLTAGEFGVREAGADMPIENVKPATDSMAIDMMTDRLGIDATFTTAQTRAALGVFVHTILDASPDSRIAYRTIDGASVLEVKPTSSVVQLDTALKKLFTNNRNPVLLEAIADACDDFRRASTQRRLIFALVASYKADTSSVTGLTAANGLRESRASLWAIEANNVTGGVQSAKREGILLMGTRDSGGMLNVVNVGTALEGAAERMAKLMLAQYAITYVGAKQPTAPSQVQVGTSRPNTKVLYPHWTFGK